MPLNAIRDFFRLEASAGILLVGAALLAIIIDNISFTAPIYDQLLFAHLTIEVEGAGIDKPLLLWINDGLMAVFFMLVGLELKREILEGQLSNKDQILLPALAAFGGMAAPALVYTFFNAGDDVAMTGWAIPAATDIAFALGVLTLLGDRVPLAAKVFLTAVAIVDDLGAIMIIAIFYTADLSLVSLGLASLAIIGLFALNRFGVTNITPYMVIGAFLWFFVLKSGVHATLAGVIIAFAIPMKGKPGEHSPVRHLEHALHPWVAYAILPIFAFANAGLHLLEMKPADILNPIPLGIALGLIVGKQIGVFGLAWMAIKLKWAAMPQGMNWGQLYGVCVLTGIGFTMSLFIAGLAFSDPMLADQTRLGILAGSITSAVMGALIIHLSSRRNSAPQRGTVTAT